MDYAYTLALKNAFNELISLKKISQANAINLHCYIDEHDSAANGRYELRESLESEFQTGTYNANYNKHFPLLLQNLSGIGFHFCDSSKTALVRASDIIANNLWHQAKKGKSDILAGNSFFIKKLPR